MPDSSKTVLVNILFIILPIILYYIVWGQKFNIKNNRASQYLFMFFSMSSTYLTMSYPINVGENLYFDFRYIPLLFVVLYLPLKMCVYIFLFILLYDSYLSPTIEFSFIFSPIIFLVLSFVYRLFFHALSLWKKSIYSGLLLLLSSTASFLLYTLILDDISIYIKLYSYVAIAPTLTAIIILLIERIRQMKNLQVELKENEQMKLVSQLAASVAHEVRNPMTVSKGFIQLLMKSENISDIEKDYLKLALSELDRAQVIITDYLSLSKPNNDAKHLFNASQCLKKVVNSIEPFAAFKNVEVLSELEEIVFLLGSEKKLIQAVVNILKNGIEAMPDGGQLFIRLFKYEGRIYLKIKDEGIGMSKEQLDRLGTAYYTTKDTGTGLGLTTSYDIIKSMDGKINVTSKKGQGSQFLITFPNSF